MTIHFREATLSDEQALKDCLQQIVAAERPMDSCLKEGHIEYYDPLLFVENENSNVIVAEVNHSDSQTSPTIIGCGAAQIKPTKDYYHYSEVLYLAMMYVHQQYRGKGINGEIIQQLLAWGKAKGVEKASLTVYPQNPSAIKAYQKLGFEPALLEMRLRK